MFCNNCGAKLEENAVFCQQCGARMEEVENQANEPLQQDAVQNSQPDSGANTATEQTTETVVPEAVLPDTPKKKKGAKKPLLITLISVLCILVAGTVATFASATFRNFLFKTFLPSDMYFKYVLAENAKDLADVIDDVKNQEVMEKVNAKGEVTFEVGDGFYDMIDSVSGENVSEQIGWLKSMAYTFDMATADNGVSADLGLKANGVDLADFNMAVDLEKGYVYMASPTFSDTAVRTYTGVTNNGFGVSAYKEIVKAIPEKKVVEKIAGRYLSAAVKEIDKVEKGSEKVEIGEVSQKLTTLTVEFDGEMVANMSIAVLKEIKEDEEFEEIFTNFCKAKPFKDAGIDAGDLYDEFIEEVEYAIDDLEDNADDIDVEFEIKFYVNNQGEIVGMELDADGGTLSAMTVEKGKNFATEVKFEEGSNSISVEGTGVRDGKKVSGDLELCYGGMSLVNINYSDVDEEKAKDGNFVGKISITAGKKAGTLLRMVDADAAKLLEKAKLDISATENSGEIAIYNDIDMLVKLKVTAEVKEGGSVKIPTAYVDVDDSDGGEIFVESLKENAVPDLLDKMRKIGVPEEYVTELEEGYNYSKLTDEEKALLEEENAEEDEEVQDADLKY